MDAIDVMTLEDGGQEPEDVAARLVAWLGEARETLDLALYDVRLPGAVGDEVAGAIRGARDRGVAVRIMFNQEEREEEPRPFEPPPPRTEPDLLEQLGVPLKAIPGWRDLMHHKYVVRDRAAVWTGSANWTIDNWTRAENVLASVASPELAAAYGRDFDQLWQRGKIDERDGFDAPTARVGEVSVRPWFCPGRGPELSHRIAKRMGAARRRIRVASPVLTAGPILGTMCELIAEGRVDIAGVCDATQVAQVFEQWEQNQRSHWKAPLLQRALTRFHGKHSTPYRPDSVHDFMHAKVTVCDETTFLGSFNLSRSGETNAENVLEIADAALAERMASWIDGLRERYPPVGS
jgi:phosphatidylserine/phosphatidylglycerophosphate/cardiolipin synthase-like enzyme